jgi:hypothetical protein
MPGARHHRTAQGEIAVSAWFRRFCKCRDTCAWRAVCSQGARPCVARWQFEVGDGGHGFALGGYFDGLSSIGAFDVPTWNLGLSFSYPIGMRSAKANMQRAQLQMQQRDLSIRSQELAIVTEVTNAALAVSDTRLQLAAATRSRELSEESASAEITRFNAGVATNYEVVQAQDALTSSRISELRAIIDHVNAIAEFDLVQRVGN